MDKHIARQGGLLEQQSRNCMDSIKLQSLTKTAIIKSEVNS